MDNSKKLYRAGKGHVIGGVCAGFADYFSVDVALVRILWLVLTLVNGIGAIAYLVCLVLIPKNPEHEKLPASEQTRAENSGLYIGVALVVLGLSFAFNKWFDFFWWDFDWFFFDFYWHIVWPILFILLGVWLIVRSAQKTEKATDEQPKKFYRSRENRLIGGVCGGLAEYWNVDVTLVRVAYVLIMLLTAVWLGVFAYVAMLILVKERDDIEEAQVVEEKPKKAPPRKRKTAAQKEESSKEQPEKEEDTSNEQK